MQTKKKHLVHTQLTYSYYTLSFSSKQQVTSGKIPIMVS